MNVQSSPFSSATAQQLPPSLYEASTLSSDAATLATNQQESQKHSGFFNSAGNSDLSDSMSQNLLDMGSETIDLGKVNDGSMGIVAGGCYCDHTVDENGKIEFDCHDSNPFPGYDSSPFSEFDPDLVPEFMRTPVQAGERTTELERINVDESVEAANAPTSEIIAEPYDDDTIDWTSSELSRIPGSTPSERTPGHKYEMIQEHINTTTPDNSTSEPSSEVSEPYTGPTSNFGDFLKKLFGL